MLEKVFTEAFLFLVSVTKMFIFPPGPKTIQMGLRLLIQFVSGAVVVVVTTRFKEVEERRRNH